MFLKHFCNLSVINTSFPRLPCYIQPHYILFPATLLQAVIFNLNSLNPYTLPGCFAVRYRLCPPSSNLTHGQSPESPQILRCSLPGKGCRFRKLYGGRIAKKRMFFADGIPKAGAFSSVFSGSLIPFPTSWSWFLSFRMRRPVAFLVFLRQSLRLLEHLIERIACVRVIHNYLALYDR